MKILAVESSCDETAASVVERNGNDLRVLSNIVASQIDIHAAYGGVVPEVAARAHIENVIPCIKEALSEATTKLEGIDRIAVTCGPGLIGSLVVGVETAKAIAITAAVPIFPINHLEGHIYAAWANEGKAPEFPLVALLVSGGNTLLILMTDHTKYEVVGQTRDDAAGEAFDKGAKLMGLGYPGGPQISKMAEKGNPEKYDFPIIDLTEKPKRGSDGFLKETIPSLDFSFSGLKTSLLSKVKAERVLTNKKIHDLAAGFEGAIVDTLIQNSIRAINRYNPKAFILAGGVAANRRLRDNLGKAIHAGNKDVRYIVPKLSLCGDNAAMIGIAASYKKEADANSNFSADPSLKLG